MKRWKLTPAAKFLILLIVVALVGSGVYFGFIKGNNSKKEDKKVSLLDKLPSSDKKTDASDDTINLSLDEWVGWSSIILAEDAGYFDDLGIDVNIHVINDAEQSSNALIKGDLNAAGYTINRTAFLSQKFKESNVDIIMPYITNYSNGGDGIIATEAIKSVDDLVNAKIGVPQFSEAHSLVVWFVNQSDLSDVNKKKVIENLIFFDTPDDVAKAFFAGQIDVAATWQPYLTQAESTTNCHVLFSTASSTRLIMDGIVFRKDFAEAHPETVQKFIDGCLKAMDLYGKEFDAIRETMPMFAGMADEEIKASTEDAALADWQRNMSTLKDEAPTVYTDMCKVWESIGETVNKELVETLFDVSYIEALSSTYESIKSTEEVSTVKVTEENKQDILDATALLKKSASVNFVINTAKFTDSVEATKTLDEFISIAKTLDGAIIEIAGNTDPNPISDPDDKLNIKLSKQRAETVKKYFIMNGIDADRIITVGNGSSNPIVKNDTEEHKAMNRRTDVSFKVIEQ